MAEIERYNPLLGRDIQDQMRKLRSLLEEMDADKRKKILQKLEEETEVLETQERQIAPIKEALQKALDLLPKGENVTIGTLEGKFIIAFESKSVIRLVDSDDEKNNMVGYDPNLSSSDNFEVVTIDREDDSPNCIFVMDALLVKSGATWKWGEAESIFDLNPSRKHTTGSEENRKNVSRIPAEAPLTEQLIKWAKDQVEE